MIVLSNEDCLLERMQVIQEGTGGDRVTWDEVWANKGQPVKKKKKWLTTDQDKNIKHRSSSSVKFDKCW